MTAPDSFDLLVGGLLGAIALPIAGLAVGGLASGEGFALWFGAGMAVSSLGLGISAVQKIRSGLAAVRAPPPDVARVEQALAVGWDVDADTWARFWAVERRERLPEAFGMWLGLAFFGGLLLATSRDVGWREGFAFSALFGGGFTALWLVWVTRGGLGARRRVDLRGSTLYIGGTPHVLRSARHRLLSARIDRERDPAALEITVGWDTRGGPTSEEVRAPVPPDRLPDADVLLALLTTAPDADGDRAGSC